MTTRQILVAAREVLKVRGWCQWVFETPHGEVCARGALGIAIGGKSYEGVSLELEPVCNLLRKGAGIGDFDAVAGWNDEPGRTKEEVLAAFDKAILLATEGVIE